MLSTFLLFEGRAGEALALYGKALPGFSMGPVERYSGEDGPEGWIKRADFSIQGHSLIAIDSPISHGFTFTPSISLFARFENDETLDAAHALLVEDGSTMMPLDAYPFAPRFTWIADRFGVSWQLIRET